MKRVWQLYNNKWYLRDISGTVSKLENVIYSVKQDPQTGELYLNSTGKKFEFDFKLYGLKSNLIERAVKYYNNSKGNLGVLLNGVKGTGKTITGKILANELNLPIIIVGNKYGGLINLISQIDSDVIIMIDEYEKIFSDATTRYNPSTGDDEVKEDATLLSLMDGVFSNSYRRTFILTTNEIWLNENMINRPGRIRYKETFEDLEFETINEIIDDLLIHKNYKDEIIEYVKTLKLITVDILKAIITEVNIFNEPPIKACVSMNLEFLTNTYSAYQIDENGDKALLEKEISLRTYEGFMYDIQRNYRNANIYLSGNTYRGHAKFEEGSPISLMNSYDKEDLIKVIFIEEKPTHRSFSHNLDLVF